MTQKTLHINEHIANRQAFLDALYPQVPANLWLEVRCIHPVTGEVRMLWTRPDHVKQRDAVLKQADRLNADGFGVYFAPCLRAERKGSAEAAALMPALWVDIDCDNDPVSRERGLAALHAFDPPPSVIVDSGGGWHGYWLLDTPFVLDGEADKQRVAAILRGLFAALGGDAAYVKSTASVMRLPDSLNTKLGRDGAAVQIVAWRPEQRCALEEFDWLAVTPSPNGHAPAVATNGQHPLPPRTAQYLTSGAHNGSRNAELFAAACQMRDAGYSQADAERELIGRHVANGNGSENPAARDREARATIASAYRQAPREPIAAPKERARRIVDRLVGQYQADRDPRRPTTPEIVEAVEACAQLNAVEWAEARQRLKSLCGEGMKIGDIDKLYREKKREHDRQRQQAYVDAESYILLDGRMVYRRESYRGSQEKTVADWSAIALYQTCQVDDDGKEVHHTALELRRGQAVKRLDVPGDVFVDDVALRRFIGANAGSQYVVRAGMSKHLTPAIVHLSGEFPTHRHYNFMGWMPLDGRWVYVSPQDCITSAGKLEEPLSVELDHRLRDYGLHTADWSASLAAFDAVTQVLPPQLAPGLIAFALLPVLQRFFPAAATRPAVHLVGTSGSGKSEIASLLSSFYGEFSRDTPPAQWGDTINTVETLGYPLADALYWVDDYKSVYADEKTFTRFLQSYSRGMGRGRLTREAKMRQEKPCRGLILSTGETTIEGEMSVVARMLVLEVPPWEKRDPGGQALSRAEDLRDKLPGFTAHFASWVASQLESGDLKGEIAQRFGDSVRGYKARLAAELGKQSNNDRVVKNWAVLLTVYQLLSKFLRERDEDYVPPAWQDVIVQSVRALRQERASEVFLDILSQLIAGGQAVIDDDMKHPREYPPGVTVVGYRDEGFIYLLPEIAHREVSRVQPLRFTVTAIGMQLKEDGLLVPGPHNLSTQKRVRGGRVRFWQLTGESLG